MSFDGSLPKAYPLCDVKALVPSVTEVSKPDILLKLIKTLSVSILDGKPLYVGAKLITLHFPLLSLILFQASNIVSALIVNDKSVSLFATVSSALVFVFPVVASIE